MNSRCLAARAITLSAAVATSVCVTAFGQPTDTLRICTYNVLNFGTVVDPIRVVSFQDVLGSIRPHILVLQEIEGAAGLATFMHNAATTLPGVIEAPFVDGPDSDNALLIDTNKVSVVGHAVIQTPLRNVDRWRLIVKSSNDTIDVWSLHLKAGDTEADALQRQAEATLVRQSLDSSENRHRVVAGDLNTYASSEGAYFQLTYTGFRPAGEVEDPIGRPGNWHSDSAFADIHTQSTRTRQAGGGIGGGVDDRFDFLLLSPSLRGRYLEGSYTAFGNDGEHFNDSINAPPNRAVGTDLAQSLHDASDHLPVFMDLVFVGATSGVRDKSERLRDRRVDLSER